jgi:hypothetical protein
MTTVDQHTSRHSPRSITEDQAKTMWCPFSRTPQLTNIGGYGVGVVNRASNGQPHPASLCLASGCMAWVRDQNTADFGYCGMATS